MESQVRKENLYKVISNSDKVEGRGRTVIVGYFIDNEVAQEAVKKEGYVGKSERISCYVVVFENKMYIVGEEVNSSTEAESVIKQRALAKLSDKERKVLEIK